MNDINILTPGEKIKRIRKKLKIKQHEITGNKITRNLISIIENNKANLTVETADIIANNINKFCAENDIDFTVTTSYLLDSVESQANRIADEYIDFLDAIDKDELESKYKDKILEIEKFLSEYKTKEKKTLIYEKLGEIYRDSKEYHKAYTYFIKSYEHGEHLFNNPKLISIILNIGYCCIRLKRYKEALDFNQLASIYSSNLPRDLLYILKHNNVIAYKNLGDYDQALSIIDNLENDFPNVLNDDLNRKLALINLKANCMKRKKRYTDALRLHKSILNTDYENILNLKLLALSNILNIYVILNDTKNLKLYINKSINLIQNTNNVSDYSYIENLYYNIGNACYKTNLLALAKEYFDNGITRASETKNTRILINSLDTLLTIYSENNNSNNIDNLKNQILEFISLGLISHNERIIFKLINHYSKVNDTVTIDNLTEFILDLKESDN